MSLRFEDVIVQKPPASRVYCEHSFVTWSAPLRDSLPSWSACWLLMATADKPGTTFFGAVVSEQDVVTKEAMMAVAMRSLRWIIVNNLKRPPRGTYRRSPDLHCGPSVWWTTLSDGN